MLEVVLEEGLHEELRNVLEVSILILLEVVLEVERMLRLPRGLSGFNPYFAGSSSGSFSVNPK